MIGKVRLMSSDLPSMGPRGLRSDATCMFAVGRGEPKTDSYSFIGDTLN